VMLFPFLIFSFFYPPVCYIIQIMIRKTAAPIKSGEMD
jgi:hypothetical protein